jgi:hypothetical protein
LMRCRRKSWMTRVKKSTKNGAVPSMSRCAHASSAHASSPPPPSHLRSTSTKSSATRDTRYCVEPHLPALCPLCRYCVEPHLPALCPICRCSSPVVALCRESR